MSSCHTVSHSYDSNRGHHHLIFPHPVSHTTKTEWGCQLWTNILDPSSFTPSVECWIDFATTGLRRSYVKTDFLNIDLFIFIVIYYISSKQSGAFGWCVPFLFVDSKSSGIVNLSLKVTNLFILSHCSHFIYCLKNDYTLENAKTNITKSNQSNERKTCHCCSNLNLY